MTTPLSSPRCQITVISLPRCGTSSIASIFQDLGSINESDEKNAVFLYSQYALNLVPLIDLNKYLESRYRNDSLWIDCSSFNFLIIPELVSGFPDMKFIALYRELSPWLNSFFKMLSYYFKVFDNQLPTWMTEYGKFYSSHFSPHRFLNILNNIVGEAEIAMMTDFCQVWLDTNLRIRRSLPNDRTFFLDTKAISFSLPSIEIFFNLEPATLSSSSHVNKARIPGDILPISIFPVVKEFQNSFDSFVKNAF